MSLKESWEWLYLLIQGNYVTGGQVGPNIIKFVNGDEILFFRPQVKIKGLLMGDRILEYFGEMTFYDKANRLE